MWGLLVHLFSIVLLGIAANLDNLGIGIAYGVRRVRIPFTSNLIIAALSGIATLITSLAGHLLNHIVPGYLCNLIGGCIVSLVGVFVIVTNFVDRKTDPSSANPNNEQMESTNAKKFLTIMKQPEKADMDYSGHISSKESVLLGIALSINCLATGLGAGMTGLNVIGMTLSVILFSLLTIFLGVIVGKRYISCLLGDKATILAGILLLVIGIYEMFI